MYLYIHIIYITLTYQYPLETIYIERDYTKYLEFKQNIKLSKLSMYNLFLYIIIIY